MVPDCLVPVVTEGLLWVLQEGVLDLEGALLHIEFDAPLYVLQV